VRRRFAPHQLRHAHAVELAREGVPLNVIQRQLAHANLGTTSVSFEAAARPPWGGPGQIPGHGPGVSATQLR
jgi:integrase